MKSFILALLATPLLALSANAQTCADYNAQDSGGRLATVTALMESEPGLFSGRAATNDTNSTNPTNEIQPSTVAEQIDTICADDPNKSLVEAAREQTAPTLGIRQGN